MWGNKFKCLDQESRVTRRASNIARPWPEYLSRAESWLEWDSRQSQFLPESFSSPHSAQWNSGCSGRSHRVSPSVPSKANINTHGDGNPGRHTHAFPVRHRAAGELTLKQGIKPQKQSSHLHQRTCCSECPLCPWGQRGRPSLCLYSHLE